MHYFWIWKTIGLKIPTGLTLAALSIPSYSWNTYCSPKVTGTRSETLSFSKRAFDPSSSRFWPLKTRIFGCTFLTHHLSELYNLCSWGVKSLPRKIFHTFFVQKTAKVSQPNWLWKRIIPNEPYFEHDIFVGLFHLPIFRDQKGALKNRSYYWMSAY